MRNLGYNEKNYDKDKETAMELMCRRFDKTGESLGLPEDI